MTAALQIRMNKKKYQGLGYAFDQILEWYGIQEQDYTIQNDEYLRMACPIHGGDNNSAFVWRYEFHSWSCYSHHCHEIYEGNSAFHFVLGMEKGDLKKTIEVVRNILSSCQIDINEKLVERRKHVKHICHKDQVEASEIDQASFTYSSYADLRGIPRNLQQRYKIGTYKTLFPDKIGFPVFDMRGRIVGITLRQLHDGMKPKWIHKPDGYQSGINLYNINWATPYGGIIVVTEGPMDVLKLVSCGFNNCVASFRCSISKEQIDLLKEIGTHKVLIAFDNDEAGDRGCRKAAKLLRGYGMNAERLKIIGYKDFGEMPQCLIRRRKWTLEKV